MPKSAFIERLREKNKFLRDAISRGEHVAVARPAEPNSFKAAPLREWAKGAGIDENDPLLVRALAAQEKADWSDWTSWLDMEEAVLDFMEVHCEFKDAWPPNTEQIERFLQKAGRGQLTATEVEEFRRLAEETFREWQPQYSPAFKERIKSALSLLHIPLPEES